MKMDEYELELLDAVKTATEFDMLMLKRRSAELNIPYQTILSSLIHQYVTKKVKLTF
ncbi:hypothetical protein JHD50_00775 [Sulfurimonas sp. MAG313]|nr:hypothetical protein [Sulfurimonas sp. MAG313]MDF1879845.1 hypothetical protein [Sulfurimonas sp. MAG313]